MENVKYKLKLSTNMSAFNRLNKDMVHKHIINNQIDTIVTYHIWRPLLDTQLISEIISQIQKLLKERIQ